MIVGILFFYAGTIKISFPGDFALSIQNYQIIPLPLTNLLAILIPWLEIICGLFLISGFMSRGSALILTILAFGFTVAMIRAWLMGLDIECGCFGKGSNIDLLNIGKNLLLLFMCFHILIYPSPQFTLDRLLQRLP